MKNFLRQVFLTFAAMAICFQVTATTVTWDGGAGTDNWTDAMNWDTDALPTMADDVDLNGDTVVLTASTQVQRVYAGGSSSLTINMGVTLTIDGFAGGDDGLEVQNSGTVLNNGTIAISNIDVGNTDADGLYNKGTFTNNGTITIDGVGQHGLYLQQGTFTNNATGVITITNVGQGDSNADYVYMDDNSGTIANFHNHGDLDITMTGTDDGIYIKDGSVLTNHSTGTIDISSTGGGDMSLHIVGNSNIPTPSTLDNLGTFTINGNGTTDYGIQIDGANTDTTATTTAILINSGTLTVNDAGDNSSDDGIRIRRSGAMTNNAGGVVNVINAKDEGIQIEDSNHSTGVFNNSGTVNIVTPADHGMELFGTFNNLTGGIYQVTGAIDDGIRMRNTGLFNNDGAVEISGSGSDDIETDGLVFANTANATFAIGDNGIGVLEIRDAFDLGASTITFEISDTAMGTGFDQLQNFTDPMIVSNATMHLDWGSYVPAVGNKFKVIDGSGDVTGTFSAVTNSNSDIIYTVNYDTSEVEIEVTGISGVVMKSNPDLPITFEDTATVDYNIVDFGNITGSMVVVDPTDPNNLVVTTTKPVGAETWAGTVLGDAGLTSPIPFTATDQKMSVRVWSPTANTPILLKVENLADGNINAEVQMNTTTASAWETIEFDFANPTSGTIDLNNTYSKVVIFYDFGTSPTAATTYYCDDVMFVEPPVTQTKPSLPITFEDTIGVDYNFADFGGTYTFPTMVVVDPTDPTNLVAQTTKPSMSQTWAGTVLGGDGLTSAIPFTASNQKMYVDVWVPTAGTPILLKVEDASNDQIFAEVQATTTTGGMWETLEFDLANSTNNAIDLNNTYDKVVIFYNFGTAGADVTYYCDNVSYGSPYTSTRNLQLDANLFTIRPNLASDFTTINFANESIAKQKTVKVFNAFGQLMSSVIVENTDTYQVSVNEMPSGMYFITVNTDNKMATKRLVVQH